MNETIKEFVGKKFLFVEENSSAPLDPRVWREAQTLKNAGAKVIIICPKAKIKHHQEKFIVIDGISIYRYKLSYSKGTRLGYLKEYITAFIKTTFMILKVLFRYFPIHVIHAANPPDIFWPIGLCLQIFRTRFIFDEHDLGPETYLSRFKKNEKNAGHIYKLQKLMQRLSYRVSNAIISTNESYKAKAVSVNPKNALKTFVVRNGPDTRWLKPINPDPSLKKGRSFLAAFFGVMGVQDGVDYLIRSINVLVKEQKFDDLIVYLIGTGDDVPRLRKLIQELKLDDYFVFTGFAPWGNVIKILSTADVCLSPDPKNLLNDVSTMNKIMEYMAMGKAIVSFDLKEARVSAGESALYVESNNIQAFAGGILRLIHDPQLCKKMGEIGRRRIEEELSWQKQEINLIKVYRCLLNKKSKRI